jgi:phasin family protein
MNNFMNNPLTDMFKKAFESSTSSFGQPLDIMKNADMTKYFNPTTWVEMSSKMFEHFPWMNQFKNSTSSEQAFDFAKNFKGLELFSDLGHLSLENSQAMLRRQAEIFQKYSNEYNKFMQNMSTDPQANIELHNEFARTSFESLVNDFKELSEMYSKANLETLEATSTKVTEVLGKKQNCSVTPFCVDPTKKSAPAKKKPKAKK